ncbi:MAG: adenosylcobinamide-GDP ribazoletransferase [Synergistaceae bacterium]|jgi:adenosylcobinamide-GDP ribazoletransferase|nr:adenosylcobinamide-GDP ribazoletransferase [Synergistaceae bacterium]
MFMDILAAAAIALSFLTVLPAPHAEWTPARLRYFPVVLPLAGLAVGGLGIFLFVRLSRWGVSVTFRAVLMTLFYLFITGGLHMDGFMDTCDAVFSRQGREERLKILADASAGAFAVMGCAAVLLLKVGIFSELLGAPGSAGALVALTLLPVYSRLGVGALFYLPFAREDGLALTLGKARLPAGRLILLGGGALSAAAASLLGLRWLVIPLFGGVFLHFYGHWCVRVFGGVTGDLLGAFVELSETLMLLVFIVVRE